MTAAKHKAIDFIRRQKGGTPSEASPVVELIWAVAVMEAVGAAAALEAIDALRNDLA